MKRKTMSNNQAKTIGQAAAAIVLAVALFGGGMVVGMGWATDWTYEPITKEEQPEQTDDNTSAVITPGEENGVHMMTARIMSEDFAEYGVSPLAESAYTLTATVTPSDATNKAVDYTAAWKNPSSSWASGKNVSDYVTVTQPSDGSLTATVECKQAFGEQVIITCAVRDNVDAKATCTVDYEQKFLGADISISGHDLTDTTVNWNMSHENTDVSVEFPTLKNTGSFDQNWVFTWCNVGVSGGTGTYGSYTVNSVYSDVYTIEKSSDSYAMGVCITQDYYDILNSLGYTLNVSPDEYIGFNVDGELSIGNLILQYWSNNTFADYDAYVELRTTLKSHAGKAMFRIKVAPDEMAVNTDEAKIYNVSFSASSFNNILADGVSLDDTELVF